jgi:hypothetical protein
VVLPSQTGTGGACSCSHLDDRKAPARLCLPSKQRHKQAATTPLHPAPSHTVAPQHNLCYTSPLMNGSNNLTRCIHSTLTIGLPASTLSLPRSAVQLPAHGWQPPAKHAPSWPQLSQPSTSTCPHPAINTSSPAPLHPTRHCLPSHSCLRGWASQGQQEMPMWKAPCHAGQGLTAPAPCGFVSGWAYTHTAQSAGTRYLLGTCPGLQGPVSRRGSARGRSPPGRWHAAAV